MTQKKPLSRLEGMQQWLNNEIESISLQVFDGFLTFNEFMEQREQLFKQAKEMEKCQIIDAYAGGVLNECSGANIRSNQYYEYNYGNKG